MKKIMLVALVAVSAMLALPALASALPAHVSSTGGFTLHGGASELSRVAGGSTTGTTTTGTGNFETTTTGKVKLTFHGVNSSLLGPCNSSGQPSGTVTTTELPFHLVMLATNQPGILITSNAGHLVTFTCGFASIQVKGNGILGTITAPKCGASSNTATVSFVGTNGVQQHQSYTGTNYSLESSLFGSFSQSAMTAHATITFSGGAKTLTCTH